MADCSAKAATPADWRPDLIAVAATGSVLIVVALWLHGGNLQAFAEGGPGALTSVGRLTGLISADLLLIQVLLMVRIPWIEQSYGRDRLVRWHRIVGFTSINLMLVHIVLVTLGYSGTARSGLVSQAWALTTTYPGMLLAIGGTAALVMVAITSVRAARARLRYESWHLLHLYAYLGVGLSLPHELWTGADFLATPPARVYWWTVYLGTAGCVVIFRIGVPIWRTLYHDLRIEAVVPESPGVFSIHLRGRHLTKLRPSAGQYFHWRFLGAPGWTRAHPYSLSAAPRDDRLRITIKNLGDGSATVSALRSGTRVMIEGPYGRLTGARRQHRRLAFFACGIGITPLRALLESEPYQPGEAVLIYRVGEPSALTFAGEIDRLARNRGVAVHYLAGRRRTATSWLPDGYPDDLTALRWLAPNVARSDVFVCGPQAWMDALITALLRAGVAESRIHSEKFTW